MTIILATAYLHRRLNNGEHLTDPLVSSTASELSSDEEDEEYFADISLLSTSLDLDDIENIDPLIGAERLETSTPTLPVTPEPMGCPIAGYTNGFVDYQPGPSRHAPPRSGRTPLGEVGLFLDLCMQFTLLSSFYSSFSFK